jgi:hypothetical protein
VNETSWRLERCAKARRINPDISVRSRTTSHEGNPVDGAQTDWVVVCNRVSMLDSRNKQRIARGLGELAAYADWQAARHAAPTSRRDRGVNRKNGRGPQTP